MPDKSMDTLVDEFRAAIKACERLYLDSARICIEQHPDIVEGDAQRFQQMMDDLHKGLLIKIYVYITEADQRWTPGEKRLAETLFDHVWPCGDHKQDLRAAASRVFGYAANLQWYSLFRPFDQIAALRNRVGELETIVVRLANVVASADGEVSPMEITRLRTIQNELDLNLKRLPLDEPGHHEEARSAGAQAVKQLRRETTEIEARLETTPAPARAEPHGSPKATLEEVLSRLDQLVGLARVKHEIHTLTNFLRLQSERAKAGLPQTRLSLHMVFGGNPGTGKTTVARLVGQILGTMGILQRGHLVETDRAGLVAEYAGQTSVKTHKKIDEALDGVLFIDEAYSLVSQDGSDAYGQEALQALLKRMEDDRQRLVVILAGYTEPMERLLRSNPGLSSRFNTRLTFPDYEPRELGQILQGLCNGNNYVLPGPAQARLLVGLQWLYEQRDAHFGNGRLVRNIFEQAIRRLANRIAGVTPLTREVLTTFAPNDFCLEGVPEWRLSDEYLESVRVELPCEKCQALSIVPASFLGRRVKCARCEHRFRAAWGALRESEPG